VALVGLRVLPPHEVNECDGLTARVDARLENLGRDVAAISLKAPVLRLSIPKTELYDEGNGLFVGVGRITVLAGRSGLAERTERRRTLLAVEAVLGTLVGSGQVG
jgi:hypothetical protein